MRRLAIRLSPLSLLVLLAGCASAPHSASVASTQRTTPHFVPVGELTGDQIVALQMQGYKLVNKNGQKLYCSTEPKLGSRLQHNNICMTEREMVTLRERTERGLQNATTQVPPKSGT